MDVFDLVAKLVLDTSSFTSDLNNVENSASGASSKIGSALGTVGKVAGGALASTVTAVSAGVATVATASAGLAKTAVENYSEYEQLTGGIETLFGDAYDSVMEDANNAFKTAGMSANDYMDTVTSFSASLIQSLDGDTAKSAEEANKAITDMSDNANKMGTSMESIQNAYQGFAKQNYTMLDNLKLGYGGTKEEMERLLEDAEKLSGQKYDVSSFSDIVDAIHVVQDEMGITGTTATEASTTIEGSVNSMKSAWTNLVTGLADENADFDQLVDNLVTSLVGENEGEGVISQILPRFETAINGVGELIEKLVPELLAVIPPMLMDLAPSLLEAGSNLVTTLVQSISSNLTQITDLIMQMVELLSSTVLDNLPTIIECGLQIVMSLVEGIGSSLPELIPEIVEVVLTIVDTLTNNIDKVVEGAVALMTGLAEGLINALPVLIEKAPTIIANFVEAIAENLPTLLEASAQMIGELAMGLIEAVPELLAKVPEIIEDLGNAFLDLVDTFNGIGVDIVKGLWTGIKNQWDNLVKSFEDLADALPDGVKSVLGIHSPSKVFAKIGDYCVQGFEEGISDLADGTTWNNAIGSMSTAPVPALKVTATNMSEYGNSNINVTLQGDANRIFKVVQKESTRYQRTTGQPAFN